MSIVTSSAEFSYEPDGGRGPLWRRINLRMVVFVAVVLGLVAYPVYVYLDSMLSGGIKSLGNGYKQVDLKAMSMFTFDPQFSTMDDIPTKWRALDGQKVVLYGEQYAPYTTAKTIGLEGYELCYSIAKCCVGGPPKIQHFVHSKMMAGHQGDYYDGRMVKAVGTLHVKVMRDPSTNFVTGIYYMDVESIELVQ